MSLKFYDTRRRRIVKFEPVESGTVKIYTCGPTVYSSAHIGNFRAYVFEDLLRRTLKYFGFKVVQVMNLTDIDDKTIRESQARGVELKDHTDPIIERFFTDLDSLNIERAEVYPRATEHIPEMISMIESLLEKGYAYKADDSIYFSVERFREYGQLSGMKLEKLARGVRVDADEYDKDNFRDFALWKGWSPEDGVVAWDAPFGKGRPGWHIECSAMSMKYLGEEFDIHTGGVDNIFPHHENEIAQSVAATGKSFARYWMHCAHLIVEGEKMSKSLGNFLTLNDLWNRGYPPRAVRYILLVTHYRQRVNFTDESVKSAMGALERLDTLYQSAAQAKEEGKVRESLDRAIKKIRIVFNDSLSEDLGISGATTALFDFVSDVHRLEKDNQLNKAEGVAIKILWESVDRVLGLLIPWEVTVPEEIINAVRDRMRHRNSREFTKADEIRDLVAENGYQLEDTLNGTVVLWSGGRKFIEADGKDS